MAEQVNIASLSIDVDDVIKESSRLKREIDSLRKSQKQLDTTTKEGAEAFAVADVEIKKLSKAYKDNQQLAVALDKSNKDLDKTISSQNKSTQELYDSRSQLQKISKNIQGNTEEEIELRNRLNAAIDAQTEAIREQSSSYIEGKDSIGEYTQGINASDISIQSLIKNSEEAGGATNLLSGGVKQATRSIGNLIKASLKFIATPLGAILAVIVGAFTLVKNAMDRSEESTAKIKKGFAAFSGVAKTLLKFLEPVGKFLIDGLVKGFELVEKGLFKALGAIEKGLRFLGLDKAADSMGNFNKAIEEGVANSKALVQAELDYNKAQRESRKTQLLYQKDAEKLRQIRDDETKTFEERIAANEKLGRTLNKQLQDELALAQKALDFAELRIKLEGETTEALDARAEALTEIIDIEERITGQQSEQLTNRVTLEKEAAAEIQAIKDEELRKEEERAKEAEAKAKEAREKAKIEAEAEELRRVTDSENRIAAIEAESENIFAIEQDRLERSRLAEIENAEKTGASVKLINDKYAAFEKQLNAEVTKFKLQQNQQVLSGLVNLFSEGSKLGKAFAVAEIANSTAINAAKAFQQAAVYNAALITQPLAINAYIQGGIILATGAAQIAKTTGIKLSGGGIVYGAGTSKSDSIPAMLSNGESVNNANSTRMFAPLYSYLNQLGGGDAFASGGVAGSVISPPIPLVDYDLLALKVSEANESLPNPIVSVTEINETNDNLTVIEDLATT